VARSSDDRSVLKGLLNQAEIDIDPYRFDLVWRYHELLVAECSEKTLVSVSDSKELFIKHYIDCLKVGTLANLSSPLLDLGSGAGLPGILLKIQNPGITVFLAEDRKPKIEFLKLVIRSLDLNHIGLFTQRITPESFQVPVKAVITRALEPLVKTLTRVTSFLEDGGKVLFMKGQSVDSELKEFENSPVSNNYKIDKDQTYRLPGLGHERRLLTFLKL